MAEEQVSAQAAVVLTLVGNSVRCTVLRGSLPELNDHANDLANLLVSVSNAGDPPFDDDPRITALAEENAKLLAEVERLKADIAGRKCPYCNPEELRRILGDPGGMTVMGECPSWMTDFSGKPFHKEECQCEACLEWLRKNKEPTDAQ